MKEMSIGKWRYLDKLGKISFAKLVCPLGKGNKDPNAFGFPEPMGKANRVIQLSNGTGR